MSNWYYLTGSLRRSSNACGTPTGCWSSTVGAGAMIAHSDLAFVIDAQGHERDALIDDPGPTQTFASSFSSLLLSRIDSVLSFVRSPWSDRGTARRRAAPRCWPSPSLLVVLAGARRRVGSASAPGAPRPSAPLASAVSTPSDSWVIAAHGGALATASNTFWQLLHAAPGRPTGRW